MLGTTDQSCEIDTVAAPEKPERLTDALSILDRWIGDSGAWPGRYLESSLQRRR